MTRHRRTHWILGSAMGGALAMACTSSPTYPSGSDEPIGTEYGRADGAVAVLPPIGVADASRDVAFQSDVDVEGGVDATWSAPGDGEAFDAPADETSPDALPEGASLDAPQEAETSVSADVVVTPASDAAMPNPACNPATNWSAPVVVDGLAFPSQPIVTVTADELTVAWVLDAGGGTGVVYVADRQDASAAFGPATALNASGSSTEGGSQEGGTVVVDAGTGYFAFDRVGLSADGLTLVGVSVGGTAMAEFTRTARGQAFFPFPQPADLAPLSKPLYPGEQLGDPVVSPDGDDIVYSRWGLDPAVSVYEAFRSGPVAWGAGSPQGGPALQMTDGLRERPLSLSADRLTLFVWDEVTSTALGLFRADTTGDFSSPQPYGQRYSLQASASCQRLYYVAPGSSGFALFQVTAM
jgi:hypothetical protein